MQAKATDYLNPGAEFAPFAPFATSFRRVIRHRRMRFTPSQQQKTSSWTLRCWGDWNYYEDCIAYYTNPKPKMTFWYSPKQICDKVEAAQEEESRKQEEEDRKHKETMRTIFLRCRAASVSEAQTAACVALATGH
jgi:hypothetical protein